MVRYCRLYSPHALMLPVQAMLGSVPMPYMYASLKLCCLLRPYLSVCQCPLYVQNETVLPVQAIHDGVSVPSEHRTTSGWEAFLKGVGLVWVSLTKPVKKKSSQDAGVYSIFVELVHQSISAAHHLQYSSHCLDSNTC